MVRTSREGGVWVAVARNESSLRPLIEKGFKVVAGPPRATVDDTQPMHLDFTEWLERRPEPEPMDEGDYAAALELLRSPWTPVPVLPKVQVAGVAIVMVVTGWTVADQQAVEAAVVVAKALGRSSYVILVQNDPDCHEATRDWTPSSRSHCRRVYARNDGFAAACNAGAAARRKTTRWLLFTQSDVSFTAQAVREAVAHSTAYAAVVGPSGGILADGGKAIQEVGANVRHGGDARPVDFVTGYWLLMGVEEFAEVGGWWEGVFLYFEDPDLCLRLALMGVRSVVVPDLDVRHGRSATITPRFGPVSRRRIQAWSKSAFMDRWQ